MQDPQGRTAQKTVKASTIVVGDLIYRTHSQHGDLMMQVREVETGTHDGADVFVWRGDVFKLSGAGAGPDAVFLGDMTGTRAGRGEWKVPVDGRVTKGVPPEDADWEVP